VLQQPRQYYTHAHTHTQTHTHTHTHTQLSQSAAASVRLNCTSTRALRSDPMTPSLGGRAHCQTLWAARVVLASSLLQLLPALAYPMNGGGRGGAVALLERLSFEPVGEWVRATQDFAALEQCNFCECHTCRRLVQCSDCAPSACALERPP
jgi:hypothetical protein